MFRKVTTYTVLILTLVLVGCAAEDGPEITVDNGPDSVDLVTTNRGGQPYVDAVAQSPLLLEEAGLSRELGQILNKGHQRCQHLDCQVDVRFFDYAASSSVQSTLRNVVESVRMRHLDEMPLENEGQTSWKLFEGDLARLEMGDLIDASVDSMESADLEVGRATAVFFPKRDAQAFVSLYVLHAPESNRVVTVQILDLNIAE